MSHYSALRTQFRDRESLLAALADLGYKTVEICEPAAPLVGYQGDYRDVADWGVHTTDVARAVKADVIVRRQYIGSLANDLGFQKAPDGTYRAVISDYDRGRHDDAWLGRLTQRYNLHVTKKKAKTLGYQVREQAAPDGAIKLVLSR